MLVLFPSDMLTPKKVDEFFAPEASALPSSIAVGVVDIESLSTTSLRLAGYQGPVLYRGWMLSSTVYAQVSKILQTVNCQLITSPELYKAAHELPGWYKQLAAFTPRSVWTSGTDLDDVLKAAHDLNAPSLVLRDYSKSEKSAWLDAAYVPDISDTDNLRRVAANLIARRGSNFTGGVVLREYENLVGPELRSWWIDGTLVHTSAHPDTPDALPPLPDLTPLAAAVSKLDYHFITIDIKYHVDGRWRVVELGDGQVSDRPSSLSPQLFASLLAQA